MVRLLIIAFTALATALSIAVAYVALQEWGFQAAKQQAYKPGKGKSGNAVATTTYKPPIADLPPLPPPFSEAELAKIRSEAMPKPPAESKDNLTWQQIEQILDGLRSERATRPQAGADLENWYDQLTDPAFTHSPDIPQHLTELEAWRQEMPRSPTPLIVIGRAQIQHAWQARGGGYAFTVTEEGAELFQERLADAQKALQQAADLGLKDGAAIENQIQVAKGRGLPKAVARGLLANGMRVDSSYGGMYTALAEYLLPRWYGEPGEAEQLANQVAAEVPGEEGLKAFGLIAFTVHQYDPHTLFDGEYDRQLLAKAADVLLQRYARAPDVVAFAALSAYAAQDHRVARRAEALLPPDDQITRVANWDYYSQPFRAWCAARKVPNDQDHYIWAGNSPYGNIAFDADPRYLWCGNGWSNSLVRLIEIKTGRIELELEGPRASLNDLTFDGGKHWLAAVLVSQDFKGWALWNTKAPESPLVVPVEERMQTVALSPTTEQLALGFSSRVELYDLKSRTVTATLDLGSTRNVHFLRYSADGKLLAVNETIYEATSGEKRFNLEEMTRSADGKPRIFVQHLLGFDRENRPLARATEAKANPATSLVRFAADGSTWETVIADLGERGHASAISPDYRLLAIVDASRHNGPEGIGIWDLSSGKKVKQLGGHWRHIGHLAFSPDSKQLASVETMGGVIKLWSMDDAAATPADHGTQDPSLERLKVK